MAATKSLVTLIYFKNFLVVSAWLNVYFVSIGMHNWIQLYLEEKKGKMDYRGFILVLLLY